MNLLEVLQKIGDEMNKTKENYLLINKNFSNNNFIEYLIKEQDKLENYYKDKIEQEQLLTLKFILQESKNKLLSKIKQKNY